MWTSIYPPHFLPNTEKAAVFCDGIRVILDLTQLTLPFDLVH